LFFLAFFALSPQVLVVICFAKQYPESSDMGEMVFEVITNSIQVKISPIYIDHLSSPADKTFTWMYDIAFHNQRPDAIRLRDRFWRVTNAHGKSLSFKAQDESFDSLRLGPGEHFQYRRVANLDTPTGVINGCVGVEDDNGNQFEIDFPIFYLDGPEFPYYLH
jgi:ApaG protein